MVASHLPDSPIVPSIMGFEPLLIAHRGISTRFPENTLAAFRAAAAEQCTAVEFDVQLTQDGQLVVFHDDDLGRITGRNGRVTDFRWDELALLDAGLWKATSFFGERIPRLEDLLPYWSGMRLVNIEIKSPHMGAEATVEAVADFVKKHDFPFLVSSFDFKALEYFRKLDGKTHIGVLFDGPKWDDALALAERLGATGVNPDVAAARDAAQVGRARLQGYEVHVHTVNDAATAVELSKLGVTGLFCDDVPALRALLAADTAPVLPDNLAPDIPPTTPGRLLPHI